MAWVKRVARALVQVLHQATPGRTFTPAKAQLETHALRLLPPAQTADGAVDQHAVYAHHQLIAVSAPAHDGGIGGAKDRGHVGVGSNLLLAAANLGIAAERHLDEVEVVKGTGLDVHFGAVLEAVERHAANGHVVHARIDFLSSAAHAQVMRLHHGTDEAARLCQVT